MNFLNEFMSLAECPFFKVSRLNCCSFIRILRKIVKKVQENRLLLVYRYLNIRTYIIIVL
jgi:hypothetical protein